MHWKNGTNVALKEIARGFFNFTNFTIAAEVISFQFPRFQFGLGMENPFHIIVHAVSFAISLSRSCSEA